MGNKMGTSIPPVEEGTVEVVIHVRPVEKEDTIGEKRDQEDIDLQKGTTCRITIAGNGQSRANAVRVPQTGSLTIKF